MKSKPTTNEIDSRISEAKDALKEFGYDPADVSAREFYDYMTGEIFSDDPTTLQDVLYNKYTLIHELVEIGELKKQGRKIDKHVIMDTPKIPFNTAHFNAMETELQYALHKRDTYWAKIRLHQHKKAFWTMIQTFQRSFDQGQKKCTRNTTGWPRICPINRQPHESIVT